MWQRFLIFVDICYFRGSPKDVPYSKVLMGLFLLGNIVLNTITIQHSLGMLLESGQIDATLEVPQIISVVLSSFIISAALIYGMLAWQDRRNRFVQLFTTILGVDFLFSGLLEFLVNLGIFGAGISFVSMFIYLWSISVYIYVLKQGFELPFMQTLFLILGIELFKTLTIALMMPALIGA